jgi:hypothetical protein
MDAYASSCTVPQEVAKVNFVYYFFSFIFKLLLSLFFLCLIIRVASSCVIRHTVHVHYALSHRDHSVTYALHLVDTHNVETPCVSIVLELIGPSGESFYDDQC